MEGSRIFFDSTFDSPNHDPYKAIVELHFLIGPPNLPPKRLWIEALGFTV